MDPVTAAIIFGIGSFGVAKMSGASTKKALIAGGIGALGGYAGAGGFGGPGGSVGYANTSQAAKQQLLQKSIEQKALADAGTAASGQGFFSSMGSKFAALPPASKIGVGVAGASLVGGLMTPGPE